MRPHHGLRSLRTAVMMPPTPPPAGQPLVSQGDELTIRTYRYVRVLIVLLTAGLISAVLVEQHTANCLLGSISAYYYTPARGLFTGALIGIGVCLIAVRGENELQDGLLNVAGLFAPMVALVPMHFGAGTPDRPSREAMCIASAHRAPDLRPGNVKEGVFSLVTAGRIDSIRNNTFALLVMVGLGLLVLGVMIVWGRRHPRPGAGQPRVWPWAVTALIGALVWVLYVFAHGFYIENVHFTTAVLMFAAVSLFAVFDGIRTIRLQRAVKRGIAYVVLGAILLTGCGVIMLAGNSAGWDYTTFTAEIWGIGIFLAFWIIQTIDLWNHTSRRTAILAATSRNG